MRAPFSADAPLGSPSAWCIFVERYSDDGIGALAAPSMPLGRVLLRFAGSRGPTARQGRRAPKITIVLPREER